MVGRRGYVQVFGGGGQERKKRKDELSNSCIAGMQTIIFTIRGTSTPRFQ